MKLTPKQIIERLKDLKSERRTWESHWQELGDYILPNRNDITTTQTPGNKRAVTLLDNTGLQSNELLAGALHGMLTNPNAEFFELTTGDDELDSKDNVRLWLQKQAKNVHRILNNSNFQTEVHQLYLDLGAFGTGPMSVEDDDATVVRFGSRHIREVYAVENNKGVIDEIYREWKWPARTIIQEWGEENASKKVLDAYKKGTNEKFTIINAIYPRGDEKKLGKGPKTMPYCSQYIVVEEEHELDESGFREFPWVCPRWTKCSGETYGRSPGMNALPEAKTLNKMTEVMLKGAQKTIDPPVQMPDDGFILPIKTGPSSINYYRSGSNDRIEPIFNDARIDFGVQALTERRQRIRESFFVDQLQLNQGPQMTATEVNTRNEERMRLLGPMLGRMQSEFLRPLIDRVWEIMLRKNLITDIPPELSDKKLDVQYSSMIAKSQRLNEGQNMTRTVQAAEPFINADPKALDVIDCEAAVRELARIYGFPQRVLRSQEDISAMREARAKAQQEQMERQQDAQDAETVAKTAPAVAAVQKVQQGQA